MYNAENGINVSLMDPLPRVLLAPQVYQQTRLYTQVPDQEVGWFGLVQPLGADFLIEEIFLFEQLVSKDSTLGVALALAKMSEKFLAQGKAGRDKLARLRFWGHSHCNYAVHPSPKDDETFAKIIQQKKLPWFIRGIFNALGDANLCIMIRDRGVVVEQAPWAVHLPPTPELERSVAAEVKKNVSPLPPPKAVPLVAGPGFSERPWAEWEGYGGDRSQPFTPFKKV